MKNYSFCLVTALVLSVCLCFGCGQKAKDGKVVAIVNNYTMTVEDLKDEIAYPYYSAERKASIEEILDIAIKKQLLIQEAQRQGLDRNRTFLKTIERYWEQTLIKELLVKETQKIYETVAKEKQTEALDDYVETLQKKAKVKIYEDVVKGLEEEK